MIRFKNEVGSKKTSYRWSPTVRFNYFGGSGNSGLNSANAMSDSEYIKMLRDKLLNPEAEAGRVAIDVGAQYDKAIEMQERNMGRMGINPASPRYQGLLQDLNLARAASTAGEMSRAYREAEEENYRRLAGLAELMQREKQIQSAQSSDNSRLAFAREQWQEGLRGSKNALRTYQQNLNDYDLGSLFGVKSENLNRNSLSVSPQLTKEPYKWKAPTWRDVYIPDSNYSLLAVRKGKKVLDRSTGLYSNYV